jgi:predicted lysophospholipase L1 biosynthesis ABC-type transport system permease subunit
MQILNVGASQTDEDYRAAEEQRRADLLADSRSDANFFFWAAGLAALGTGLLPLRLNILVSIGVIDLLRMYGKPHDPTYALVLYGAAAAWVVMLLVFGFAGRTGHRWAFLAGIVLYAVDMIALTLTFSLWAFGVHAFFVFRWYQGQKALKDLNQPRVLLP